MAKRSKFKSKLAKMSKAWKNADPADAGGRGGNPYVEEGKQTAKLVKAELVEVNNGSVMVQWTFDCPVDKKARKKGGKTAGHVATRDGLETEQNLAHLKKKLTLFGYDVDEMDLAEDLENILAELSEAGPTCEVVVKNTDSGWTNVYVNNVSDEESEGDEDEDEEEDEDEDEESEEEDEESEEEEEDEDEEEEESAEIEKGSTVLYQPPRGKKQLECTVTKLKGDKAWLEDEKGKKHGPVKLELLELAESEEEDEEEGGEEEEVEEEEVGELEVGSEVECSYEGKTYKGTVASVNEKTETAKVKVTSRGKLKGKTIKVSVDDLELVD